MKKNIITICMLALGLAACQNDDTDFSAYTGGTMSTANVIYIFYNGTTATVSGDENNYVTINGADVTVNTGAASDSLLLVLSGSTSDGSLLIYRERKFGIKLAGVSIHNNDGPAINNQCGKSLYVEVVSGTTNTLTDGTSYTEQTYQQKGALFSEGQIYFSGSGTLNVVGSTQNAIACDDYIVIGDEVVINASSSTGHGIKVNDGMTILGGVLDIFVTSDGGRGIKNEARMTISGGATTITTTGMMPTRYSTPAAGPMCRRSQEPDLRRSWRSSPITRRTASFVRKAC